MNHRLASKFDVPLLAAMNARLIADERHRNRMTAAELEKRMGDWLSPLKCCSATKTALPFGEPPGLWNTR
ncbi:MAG TPA: hypothetical protein VND64_16950 [Pirellulales bacterium]|nr:hypothetical protein [Pirellulales bacterium]